MVCIVVSAFLDLFVFRMFATRLHTHVYSDYTHHGRFVHHSYMTYGARTQGGGGFKSLNAPSRYYNIASYAWTHELEHRSNRYAFY